MKKNYLSRILVFIFPLVFYAQSDFDCSSLNPTVQSEVNICKPGENVVLEAQLNNGNRLYWYESNTLSEPISANYFLDVGYIDSNVSYWVTEVFAEHGDKIKNQGVLEYISRDRTSNQSDWGLAIQANQPFGIIDVDIYSYDKGGEITIELQNEYNEVLATKNFIISDGGTMESLKKQTLNLDFEIPYKGLYYLIKTNGSVSMGTTSRPAYPFVIDKLGEIVDGYQDGNLTNGKFYAFFYNWTVRPFDIICESDRKEIKINVNDDYPDVPAINSEYVLCGDADFSLSDIQIEDTNELQWYDEEGNDLSEDTVIEEGVVYIAADLSVGGCLSEFAEVTFVYQDISDTPLAETSQTYEEGSGADLTSLEVDGENLRWYADEDKEEELPEDTLLEDNMTYYVSQTLEEHCESDLIGITVTETLGVADVYFEGLKYNNPVQDILYLSNDVEIESISVYDLSGRQLSVATDKLSSNELRMDLSGLSAGVYFFNMSVDEGNKMIKIIKQ